MECEELVRLRLAAQQLRKELEDRRNMARDRRDKARDGRSNVTDYEGFLQRKIVRASAAIEAHVAQHHCQG